MGKFIIKRVSGGFKFDLKAGNGAIIATGEIYKTLAGCRGGIISAERCARVAETDDLTENGLAAHSNPRFEIFLDKKGEYRFRLRARNGEIILASEGYKGKAGCVCGIESVKKNTALYVIAEEKRR